MGPHGAPWAPHGAPWGPMGAHGAHGPHGPLLGPKTACRQVRRFNSNRLTLPAAMLGPGSSLIWAPPNPSPSLGPIPGAQFDKKTKVRETSKELSPECIFYTEMCRISVRTTLVFTPKVDIPYFLTLFLKYFWDTFQDMFEKVSKIMECQLWG